MDNASIRSWANANGIAVSKNGNVAPDVAIAYAMAMAKAEQDAPKEKAPKAKKEKAPKAKKEKAIAPTESGELQAEFGEIFSAGTIKMVAAQHPERSREILTVGAAFLANGMRSRYAAIGKAINGETPRVKGAEKAPKATTATPKGKATTATPKATTATTDAHMVILPDGVRIVCASLADANVIASRVPGAIVAGIA